MSKLKTILIFYIKSGGGHESAAKAIKKEFTDYNHNIVLIDMLSNSPRWVQNLFDSGYVDLTENRIWLWLIMNKLWNYRWINLLSYQILRIVTKSHFENCIQQYHPEMILSTYFFGEKISQLTLDKFGIKIPNFTIVTEIFDAPKIWFTFSGNYIVFSDQAYQVGINQVKNYKQKTHIYRLNYFFNSDFNKLIPRSDNQSNNTMTKKFSILILGGGSSLPKGDRLLMKILELQYDITVNLVCGRNQKLYEKCLDLKIENKNLKINLTVWPFTDKIPSLIANSDLIITKGGPAVIFESLSQIKPILIYDYIRPQEKGNVDFVLNNNFGFYEPNLNKLKELLSQIINKPEKLNECIDTIKKAAIKSSSPDLIKYLQSKINN